MLAAEVILGALLAKDYSAKQLQRYEQAVNESWIIPELRKVRNFHAAFKPGRWLALINSGLQFVTGGRAWGIFDRDRAAPGHEEMRKLSSYGYRGDRIKQRYTDLRFDGKLTFNKLTEVY